MNDQTKKDLDTLHHFLNSYTLDTILVNEDLSFTVKRLHGVYFGLITFAAELEMLSASDKFVLKSTKENRKYLKEVCSDLGHAFFCNIQGSYKGAGMLLRSSLENFLKVVISSKENTLIEEYGFRLRERAKRAFLKNVLIKDLIDEMYKNHYSRLSELVHTSRIKQMEQTSSLNYFPKFSEAPSQKIGSQFVKLSQYFTLISCLIYKEYFLEMHPANQRTILKAIAPNYRPIVLGDTSAINRHKNGKLKKNHRPSSSQ